MIRRLSLPVITRGIRAAPGERLFMGIIQLIYLWNLENTLKGGGRCTPARCDLGVALFTTSAYWRCGGVRCTYVRCLYISGSYLVLVT